MHEPDWQGLSDARFEKHATILALVESLADEALSPNERKQLITEYCSRYEVTGRTIRNYVARYRHGGANAFLTPKIRTHSPRVHDTALSSAILELVTERPQRTVPMLRRLLATDPRFAPGIALISNRSIYRFLGEHGMTHTERHHRLADDGRMSFHRFQAARPLDLVQGDARGYATHATESGSPR